jgi:hypothetical protein
MAGSAFGWLGFALGAALTVVFEALVWTSPPPDWSHMRLRTLVGMVLGMPIIIFGGTFWLGNRIAARLDPSRRVDRPVLKDGAQ